MKHVFHVWHTPQPLTLGHAYEIVRQHADEVVGKQPLLDAYARWLAQMFPARGREDDVLSEGAPPAPCTARVIRFRVNLYPEKRMNPKFEKDTQLYRMLVMKALESGLHVLVQPYSEEEQMVERLAQMREEPKDAGALYLLPDRRVPPSFFWDYVPEDERRWPMIDQEEVQRVILTRLAAALAPHGFRVAPGPAGPAGPAIWRVRHAQIQAISVLYVALVGSHGVEAALDLGLGDAAASPSIEQAVRIAPRVHSMQLIGFQTAVCVRNAADLKFASTWLEQLALRDVFPALDAAPRPPAV